MFQHGEYLVYRFDTQPEPVDVIAYTSLAGSTIEFRDLVVYCGSGTERIDVGTAPLRRAFAEVAAAARACGYTDLVITGKRLTGASPGRQVLIRRRLQ